MKGGNPRRRRLSLLALPLICGAMLWPASSQAFVACSHSGAELTVNLTSDHDTVSFERFGSQIAVVTGYDPEILVPCGGAIATVDNTDSVVVRQSDPNAAGEVDIDLSKGPLGPGATPEADGTSEIEFRLEMGEESFAVLVGTHAPEIFRVGRTLAGTGINMNAASESPAAADSDIELVGPVAALIVGQGGADVISARGGPGLAGPPGLFLLFGFGGAGRDQLISAPAGGFLSGGGGRDRLLGSARPDYVSGGGAKDRIVARKGRDVVSAADGKRDRVGCGRSRDRAVVDNKDKPKGCENVRRQRIRKGRRPPDIADLFPTASTRAVTRALATSAGQ